MGRFLVPFRRASAPDEPQVQISVASGWVRGSWEWRNEEAVMGGAQMDGSEWA